MVKRMSLCRKQYISVRAEFRDDGIMLPQSIFWTDGREYPVDRVKKICSARSLKAGGPGDRYTVEIGGRERLLFFERNPEPYERPLGRWYVEVREQ